MPHPKVLLAFDINRKTYLSEITAGIFFQNRQDKLMECDLLHPRSLRIFRTRLSDLIRQYDGVIAELRQDNYDFVSRVRRPMITVGPEGLHLNKPWIGPDYSAIAKHLFEALIERGYQYIAFFHSDRFALPYSQIMLDQLRKLCDAKQMELHVYCHDVDFKTVNDFSGEDQILELGQFLQQLPKPCVLIAPDDHFGWRGIEACRLAGLTIPGEVSVVGVRSDDFICEACNPTLSHVTVDYQEIGRSAARLMYRHINGQTVPNRTHIGHGQLRDRESSSISVHQDPVIAQTLRFIEEKLHGPLTVDEIANAVGVSSRTLQRHFLQILGKTPNRVLRDHRASRAKKLLADRTVSLIEITHRCGLSDQTQLNRLIKEATGQTPSAIREAHSF